MVLIFIIFVQNFMNIIYLEFYLINHDIYVAAPATNHSAGSSALSVRKDIKV